MTEPTSNYRAKCRELLARMEVSHEQVKAAAVDDFEQNPKGVSA